MTLAASAGLPAALLAALALAAGAAGAAAPPHPLLASAQTAPITVVGTLSTPRQLDAHGYAVELVVERTLAGTLAPGARTGIAWEERSTTRPPRFRDGERILVALEPLPTSSLWRQRLPDGGALAVAAGGRAALAAPDDATVATLARYLALDAGARASAPGVAALFAIAAAAASPLAEAALAELVARPALEVDAAAGASFAQLVDAASRPHALRVAALALAGQRRLTALRPVVLAHAAPGDALEEPAWEALAAIDGGLPAATTRALLARDEPALRALAIRTGGAEPSDERLATLLRDDPAGAVRAAAAEALLARQGAAALDAALPLLFDPDPAAARAVALRIGALGDAAVPLLRKTFEERPYEDVSELANVAFALASAGPAGAAALTAIQADSPDARRRKLAGLALGQLTEPGH